MQVSGSSESVISTSSHTVTTALEAVTLTLDGVYTASDNLQIRFKANGADTVYVYDTAFMEANTGGTIVIV